MSLSNDPYLRGRNTHMGLLVRSVTSTVISLERAAVANGYPSATVFHGWSATKGVGRAKLSPDAFCLPCDPPHYSTGLQNP